LPRKRGQLPKRREVHRNSLSVKVVGPCSIKLIGNAQNVGVANTKAIHVKNVAMYSTVMAEQLAPNVEPFSDNIWFYQPPCNKKEFLGHFIRKCNRTYYRKLYSV
jgi:hypothetical protein